MDENKENKSIKDRIIDKVKSGQVKMRPRYYFISRSVLFIVGAIIVFALVMYFTSFVIFASQRSGFVFLPGFGLTGFRLLAGNFPWFLVLIILIFILILEIFAKRYSLVYRRPLLYSSLLVIILVGSASLLVKETPLHSRLYEQVEAGNFPLGRPLYKGPGMNFDDDFHPGKVLEIIPDGFVLQRRDGEVFLISTSTNTKFPFFDVLEVGDEVMVIGEEDDGVISAVGVREILGNLNKSVPPPSSVGPGRMMR